MKKFVLAVFTVALALAGFSQAEMPVVWEQDMGMKFVHHGTGLEVNDYSYVASDKEIAVFSNKDGHIYWTRSFKELTPNLKKIDELVPFWESEIIFLFDRKAGKDQIACVELKTGELLWTTDKYQKVTEDMIVYIAEDDGFAISLKNELVYIKARTGEELWSTNKFQGVVGKYVYNNSDQTMVMVNFIPSGIVAFFTGFKNQIVRINMKTGEVLWENTYIGRADRKVISRDFVYDLEVDDDKVILRLAGIQVYNYTTGASIWSAAFDYTPSVVKPPKGAVKWGVYGAVADPVVDGDDIYVLDMTDKKNQFVKKYDYHTGKLLWTSKEIKGAKAIPGMTVVDGVVALQIGGLVEVQYRQKTISTIIKPVNEALDRYDRQIRELERAREKAYGGLLQQVQSLAESQNALQRETGKLTSALSKPHVRGRWGELTLKRVAELAGMQDHCDFIEQASVNAGDGRMRPDMIIQLPAGRNIVVDSKVPLASYLEAQAAGSAEERETLMENHVRHVQTHIRQLSKKAYWTQFQPTPEFVVLFIPGENFFSAALARDPTLIETGAVHQIILATPTTLISLLKTIDMGWRQEAMADNAKVISALGSKLYQRLAVMTGHFKNLGRDIERATMSYNKMLGSFERRVLATARKFGGLGLTLKSDAPLPEVDPVEKQPRRLTDTTLDEYDDPS